LRAFSPDKPGNKFGMKVKIHVLREFHHPSGERCPNWPKISIPPQKIIIDNKARFGYPLIVVSV
jgi:hypothetical protein